MNPALYHRNYFFIPLLELAEKLETIFPERILKIYLQTVGPLDQTASRQIYADKADLVKKIRHMWLDVLKEQ